MTTRPVEEYAPSGHLKKWPQGLRMSLLGESPVFHLLEELERWKELADDERNRVRESNPDEIKRREKSLSDTKELIKSVLVVLAFLSAEVIFAFTQRPTGAAVTLGLILAVSHALSVTILLRAMIPPPSALLGNFIHPFEWAKGEVSEGEGARWTDDPDELFLAKDHHYLLHLNALTQFTKRSLVWAAAVSGLGQGVFLAFLFVVFV